MAKYELPLVITVLKCVIDVIGIAANSLSLSYFVKRQNKGLVNRLLMLLNACDLFVCVTNFATAVTYQMCLSKQCCSGKDDNWVKTSYNISRFFYAMSFDCTGFSTSLLSVTRTIKVCRPFYRIKGILTAASFIFYFICSSIKEFLCYVGGDSKIRLTLYIYYPLVFSLGTILSVTSVFVSSVVTANWLMEKSMTRSDSMASNRHATITILILSTVFCLLNAIFISAAVLEFCVKFKVVNETYTLFLYRDAGFSIAVNINSTVNPMIYLTRKKEMRQFLLEVWRTVKDKLSRSQAEPEVDVPGLTMRSLVIVNNPPMPLYNYPDDMMIDNEMV